MTAHAAPTADRALLSPFRHRDFRLFWTGLILSGIGSQFTTVAMAWQIYELTDSPLQIGLLGLARGIPQIVLLLVGGVLADAMDRRKPMMWTQTSLFSGSRCAKDGAHPPPDPLRPLEFGKP